MKRLAGKRALIAGAGGMMGAEFVRSFAAEGADLFLTTRSAPKLDPLAAEARSMGVRALGAAADFTSDADIGDLAREIQGTYGGVDIVLLSSQPSEPNMGDLLSTSDEDFRRQQLSIAWGPFRLLKQLAPGMIEQGGGSIITVVSSTGEEPTPGYGAYGLAKSALWTLTRYMAAEWGRYGIRVNAICPGAIATGGTGTVSADAPPAAVLARTSLGRVGRSGEVVGAAVYLASDEASYTTGQCIHVNGGRV